MLRSDRAAWLALAVLGLAAAAPRAEAQEATSLTSTLGWVRLPGAESCPGSQELARAVEARLGRRVFVSASSADLAIEGRAERVEGGGFRGVVRIADAEGRLLGERTIEQPGDDCRRLLAPLALAIALTVDPDPRPDSAPEPEPEPEPVPEPVPESHPSANEPAHVPESHPSANEPAHVPDPDPASDSDPDSDPDPAPDSAPDSPARWRLELALSPQVALGLLPFVAPGGGLAIFVTPPGFVPLYVLGAVYPWARAELADGAWIDHLAIYGGLGICPLALRDDRLALLGCAGLDAGAQVASGNSSGIEPIERERVLVQLDLALRVHVRLVGPLMFHAGATLLVPFRHEAWAHRVGGVAVVYHRPEPVAGVLDVGVGLDL